MVRADWNLTLVADQLQHAAIDPSAWPDVLSNLSRQVGAEGTFIVSTETRLAGTPGSPEIAGLVDDYYRNRWNERDERYRCLPSLFAKGVAVDQDFASLEKMKSSPYYQVEQNALGRPPRGISPVWVKRKHRFLLIVVPKDPFPNSQKRNTTAGIKPRRKWRQRNSPRIIVPRWSGPARSRWRSTSSGCRQRCWHDRDASLR